MNKLWKFISIIVLIVSIIWIANASRVYYYTINKNDIRIIPFEKSWLDKVNNLFQTKLFGRCYDNNSNEVTKIKFECKDNWEWKTDGKAWCWIVRWTENYFKWYCSLWFRSNNKDLFIFKILLNPTANATEIRYKNNLDISNQFIKNTIQKKELSCESSATSDIISALKQKTYTEDDVIKYLPTSKGSQVAVWKNWKRYWWNPDVWFVWYIDGYHGRGALQRKYEGYWVNENPISVVYDKYGIKTEIINKYNRVDKWLKTSKEQLTRLLKEINKWNYVQLWWDTCTYPEFEDWKINSWHISQNLADKWLNWRNNCLYPYRSRILTWQYLDPTTWKEKTIKWLNWEHAFYLLGYKWWVNNPTNIIVWDTNTWKHTYPTKERLRKWDKMDNRSIIVYK